MKTKMLIFTLLLGVMCHAQKLVNKTTVHTVNNGITEFNPSLIIEDGKVYSVRNGVKELNPSFVIKEKKIEDFQYNKENFKNPFLKTNNSTPVYTNSNTNSSTTRTYSSNATTNFLINYLYN